MRAVNLIPGEQRAGAPVGAGRSEGAAYAVLVLLGAFALFAFLYGRADKQISSDRGQLTTLTAQAQRAQAEASKLAPYTSFVSLREQRTKAVLELAGSRFDWAHVMHEFGRVLPLYVSVNSLTGTIAPLSGTGSSTSSTAAAGTSASKAASSTVTSATPPGSVPVFTLTGCATSQPAVAVMLNRLRLIDGVSNVTLQSSTASVSAEGGSGVNGGCGPGQPAYTVQVTFDPIPTPSVSASETTTVADTGSESTGGAK